MSDKPIRPAFNKDKVRAAIIASLGHTLVYKDAQPEAEVMSAKNCVLAVSLFCQSMFDITEEEFIALFKDSIEVPDFRKVPAWFYDHTPSVMDIDYG